MLAQRTLPVRDRSRGRTGPRGTRASRACPAAVPPAADPLPKSCARASRAYVGMLNSLSREVVPCSSRSSTVRTPSAPASSAWAERLAAPDSGAAATRRRSRPARTPSTRSILDFGITRTATVKRCGTALDRRRDDSENEARDDLDQDERDERREVDPAEERDRPADRGEDRLTDLENKVANAERQPRVGDPRQDDAHEDRQGQRSGEHVYERLEEHDQKARRAHGGYTSSR